MTTVHSFDSAPPVFPAPVEGLSIEVCSFSYEERRSVLPALMDAVSSSGGWILDRQVLPNGRVQFWFELQLRAVLDLYAAVVGAGLELTRGGHRDFTTMCMVLQHAHGARERARLLNVRLEVSFMDEDEDSHAVGASRAGVA